MRLKRKQLQYSTNTQTINKVVNSTEKLKIFFQMFFFSFFLPRDLATARNGISSMCVDLLTIPRCPTFGRFQTTRGTPLLQTTFPPLWWMRRLSSTDSGLWSRVRGFGVQTCGLSGCCTPRTMAESPTWPMKIFPRRMNAMLAVVPAVLGRPDAVFGQFSVKKIKIWINNCSAGIHFVSS